MLRSQSRQRMGSGELLLNQIICWHYKGLQTDKANEEVHRKPGKMIWAAKGGQVFRMSVG